MKRTSKPKSEQQAKIITKREFYDHLEKAAKAVIYPDKPFKHNAYKQLVFDKSTITYAIRAPLTEKEIQLLTDFAGIPFTGTAGYLTVLKELLIQRCNRQNPDSMTWDAILAAAAIYMDGQKKKTADPKAQLALSQNIYIWLAETIGILGKAGMFNEQEAIQIRTFSNAASDHLTQWYEADKVGLTLPGIEAKFNNTINDFVRYLGAAKMKSLRDIAAEAGQSTNTPGSKAKQAAADEVETISAKAKAIKLDSRAFDVLFHLGKSTTCKTIDDLARDTKLNERTVTNRITDLVEKGCAYYPYPRKEKKGIAITPLGEAVLLQKRK